MTAEWRDKEAVPSRQKLWKHHFLKERQYQNKTTGQDDRNHAPVKKAILFEGHFGLFPPNLIVRELACRMEAIVLQSDARKLARSTRS